MQRVWNRTFALALVCALILSMTAGASAPPVTAVPADSNLTVNGKAVSCGAYAIVTSENGYANNYFKLRDIAMLLSGTTKQFQVTWEAGTIHITTGAPYVPEGGELEPAVGPAQGVPNAAPVLIDGREIPLTAYTVAGHNYFKLRDLGGTLGFAVDWQQETKTVAIRTPEGRSGFDLDVSIGAEPVTLDPALNYTVDGAILLHHLFEGLMKWADDGAGNAVLAPGQAERYEKELRADGTAVYTFHLREDAKWSDGRTVAAGDFLYAWRRLADPATGADYCYMVDMVKGYADIRSGAAAPSTLGVSAPNSRTFVVELAYDCPYFLEACAFPACFPLREDVMRAAPYTWARSPKDYVSNGPYCLTEWAHNAWIAMAASDTYYDRPSLGPASITFYLMDDMHAASVAFAAGELDFLGGTLAADDQRAAMERAGSENVRPYLGTYYAVFNNQKAPFDDLRVRKAFALAVDTQALTRAVGGAMQPADSLVPPGVSDAQGPSGPDFYTVAGHAAGADQAEVYRQNAEEARRLLAEAGYPGGAGFPQVSYLYNTSDQHRAIGEILQAMWREQLGVEVELVSCDWNIFMLRRQEGDFFIARNGWISDYNDPMNFLDFWVTGGGFNDAQYANPAYDQLIASAKAVSTPEERMALLHQAEDLIIGADQAVLPLYHYTNTDWTGTDLRGVYYSPLGYYFFTRCTLAD